MNLLRLILLVFIWITPVYGNSIYNLIKIPNLEVYEIDTSGVEDVGDMSKKDFQSRKDNAAIVGKDNYLLQRLFAV